MRKGLQNWGVILGVTVSLLAPSLAYGQGAQTQAGNWRQDVLTCAGKTDSLERLTCYDRVSAALKRAPGSASNRSNAGDWKLKSSDDPFSDQDRVVLLHRDEEFNPFNRPYILNIICENKKIEVSIYWERFLGNEESIEISLLIDKGKAQKGLWKVTESRKEAIFNGNPEALIKAMEQGGVLLARVTPFRARPVTARFALTGLTQALGPIVAACPILKVP